MVDIIKKLQLLEKQISLFLEDTTEPLPPERVMENPNFRKWFGNSKVIDSHGNPLVVYHGTASEFNVFNVLSKGVPSAFRKTKDNREFGAHFGSIEQANNRASTKGLHQSALPNKWLPANVIPVYLSIQNPLYLEDAVLWTVEDALKKIALSGKYNNLVKDILKDDYDSSKQNLGIDNLSIDYSIDDLINVLNTYNYDGIIYNNKYEGVGVSYIVFSPNQIKSIYNNGQFSTTSDNISEETT